MGKTYLCNVFTSDMLDPVGSYALDIESIHWEEAREILSGGPFVQFMDQDPRMCQLLTERLGIEVRPGGTPLGLPNAYLHGDDILLVVRVEEEDGLLFTLFQKVSWARM